MVAAPGRRRRLVPAMALPTRCALTAASAGTAPTGPSVPTGALSPTGPSALTGRTALAALFVPAARQRDQDGAARGGPGRASRQPRRVGIRTQTPTVLHSVSGA